jgi:hypothetical protein
MVYHMKHRDKSCLESVPAIGAAEGATGPETLRHTYYGF